MSVGTAVPVPVSLPAAGSVYRVTAEQYERMLAAGAIGEHERVELLGGVLVAKMTVNPEHEWAVAELWEALARAATAAGAAWHVRKEAPLRLSAYDVPEPDLAVVRGPRGALRGRHPRPSEVALVVVVANTNLDEDRGVRLERYARGGVPAYWIVNLPGRRVEVYTGADPAAGRYTSRRDHGPGERVAAVIDDREVCQVSVDDLLS